MFPSSIRARGKGRFPNPVLIIGVVGLLLSLLAPTSDARNCYNCGTFQPCADQTEAVCDAKKSLCSMLQIIHNGKPVMGKQCSDESFYTANLLPKGFLGCKKIENDAIYKEICLCDTDLCNKGNDAASYPDNGKTSPGDGDKVTENDKASGPSSNVGNINGAAYTVVFLLGVGCILYSDRLPRAQS